MNHFCTVCQNGKISQLVASKPPENKKQFTQLSDNRLVFFDSQRVEPGGEGAQEGRDGVQVQPVQVDELQAGAAGQVGECVAPPGAAQHLQLGQRGQRHEGVRVVKVDRVPAQLNLL